MGDRKAGRQPRRLLDAHTHSNMRTERQTVTTTLPLEFTALGWSKSLSPVFFVFTSSGHFDIGTSQNLASCSTTADFYNTNLYYFGKQQSSEYNCRFFRIHWVS